MIDHDILRVTLRAMRDRPGPSLPALGQPLGQTLSQLSARVDPLSAALFAGAARVLDSISKTAASGARMAERLADLRTPAAPPRPSLIVLAGPGATVRRDFTVTNSRVSRLSGTVASTDWYSDGESRSADEVVQFEPSVVDVGPLGMQLVRAVIHVPRKAAAGATYRASFFINGSTELRQPVELRVAAGEYRPHA
jgi:hypothetical protein